MNQKQKMEIGELYKELRLARKIKQKDVAGENLSAAQLSKFELGHSMLSADKMLKAVEGINMTFSEFGYALNNYKPTEHQILMNEIMEALASINKERLYDLLAQYSKKGTAVYSRLNSLLIKNALRSLDRTYHIDKEDGQFLAEYLFSIEDWTAYELHLFGNTMPFLSNSDLIFLGKELVSRSKIYLSLPNYKQVLKYTYLNLISEMFERRQTVHSTFFIEELESILDVFDTFETILLKFLILTFSYLNDDNIQRIEIENYIETISSLGLDSLSDLLSNKLINYEYQFKKTEEK